ncbi:choice-of-anchor F family protein [Marinobacter sp. DUT-1]|uniref:choice-of-anchor F family protein n=1 Tax=Marinobacter sp. DUT-1 TaxID=3412037 RepID=UPI003D166700
MNTENLSVPPVDGKTLVYTDTAGTASFGWFDPVNDSGVEGLGISVYNEAFTGNVDEVPYEFAGCIMAQPDLEVNCMAPGGSGKRFKLKTTETNGPIDLVFNVTADDASKLYRVIGKLSNLTDATNSVAGALEGFRIETGFGIGNEFMPSSAEDGLSFGFLADGSSKLSVGTLAKFPGGLFGGSRVEGLPFFSVSIADFVEGTTVADEDVLETDGVIPAEYAGLFGDWLALAKVPTGWFIDHNGNPADDSILLAYDDPATDVQDLKAFPKTYNDVPVEAVLKEGGTETVSAIVYDPNGGSFDAGVNTTPYDLSNVRPLVATLDEGGSTVTEDDAISLPLEPVAADATYDGDFKILIDGQAVAIAAPDAWPANPPKVLQNGELYATWMADEGEEGMYLLASDESWVTLEDMNALIASDIETYERVPGYVQGPVEDLANVNINTSIRVADTSSWPTCTGDGVETNCTFTLRVTGLNSAAEVPDIPATPVPEGDGPILGCTAGKPGGPFDPVLPGMVLAALAGLWARKRHGAA